MSIDRGVSLPGTEGIPDLADHRLGFPDRHFPPVNFFITAI
jgi:hypothetical protein